MRALPRTRRWIRCCRSCREGARVASRGSAWTCTCGTDWGATTDAATSQLLAPAQHVVASDALAALHPPAEEGAVEAQGAEVERRAARDLAGRAAREAILINP